MEIKGNVRTLYCRMSTILRRRKQKRNVQISAPFNLRLEPTAFPGITEDEINILREKAAASCIGVAEALPRSPSAMSMLVRSPMLPPPHGPLRASPNGLVR
ncbi:hypothetical protein S40285_09877 [Stachybotrys chlorohalonatus IBT 40285]|uniref:Uncharacterized protein n=1 Tax=Stachybotrys chlorohalonatus (strain IBT 40285) TaxID=1283841 RepID=A0A084QUY1_STAC4|nr:hypothetical protein S40285_09877 [Stachybotrys chlorohalonata IBT 40285]